jgi:sigma-E factor negative regulatory protein RseC
MATEEGIVKKVDCDSHRAWVATTRSEACEHCCAKGMCHHLGGGGNDAVVEVINSMGAAVGDRILINFKTSSYLKALFLLYVFPVFCLLIGAFIGHGLSSVLMMEPSAASALFGFSFFGLAVLFIRARANRMGAKEDYRPRIVRIINRRKNFE